MTASNKIFDASFNRAQRPFQSFDVLLGAAQSNVKIPLLGTFLYVDQASTGIASVEFNNDANDGGAPFLLSAGFQIEQNFNGLKLSCAAQPGKFIRLMVGVGTRAKPGGNVNPQNAQVSISDVISPSCAHFFRNTSDGVGTVITAIILPAVNLNGIAVRALSVGTGAGAGGTINSTIIAASSAPVSSASRANAIALGFSANGTTTFKTEPFQLMNRIIPPTWGIWIVNEVTVAAANTAVICETETL